MKRILALTASLAVAVSVCHAYSKESLPAEQVETTKLRALFESVDDSSVHGPLIAATYLGDVPPPLLDNLEMQPDRVREGFDLALEAAFYSKNDAVVARMRDWLNLLEQVGKANADDRMYMYRMYLMLRDFHAAESFAAIHPGVAFPQLPAHGALPDDGVMAVMRVQDSGTVLVRETRFSQQRLQVIAVVHPTCGFSHRAIDALKDDGAVGRRVLAHVRLVAPQDGQLPLDAFVNWNSAHPDAIVDIVWKERDWPQIPDWSSIPAFYFFREGALVGRVTGWPEEGRMAEISDAWRAAGGELPESDSQAETSAISPR